jgi:hypothetical protein
MNDIIKNKIKTIKEEGKMRKTILTTVLTITVLFIFSTVSYAQDSGHFGWYNGMAAVAEKEIRTNEQNAAAKKNEKTADNITVADVEKVYSVTSEKTDETEN